MGWRKNMYRIKRGVKRSWTLWALSKLAPWVIAVALPLTVCPTYVRGCSMEPTIANLDMIIVYRLGEAKPGDIVVAKAPDPFGLVVKRVADIQGEDIYLLGDNRNNSRDSRHFGPVSRDDRVGVIILIIPTGGLISCVKSSISHLL